MRLDSPLRYPGGKAKLVDFVKAVFRENELLDGAYAEPYAGGGSVALALLFEEYASSIYINDLDPGIYAFWYSALEETDALCQLVWDTPVTPLEWERQRSIYKNDGNQASLALGFATFFLNRTNRSGIIASGGMIGGRSQTGPWALDARYNKPDLVRRIARIGRYRDRIHLSNLDAIDFIALAAGTLPVASLVYLDPPYFVKGKQGLYANYYQPEDHVQIAELLPAVPFRWLLSYDDAPAIRQLYRPYRRLNYTLRYTASERQHGTEMMFFSNDLVVPRRCRPTSERQPAGRKLRSPA